jgi:hypothetical protein
MSSQSDGRSGALAAIESEKIDRGEGAAPTGGIFTVIGFTKFT